MVTNSYAQLSTWSTQQVCDWATKDLQLPQYVPTLRKNKVDGRALLRFTLDATGRDEVLLRLGISDRVHRTALLAGVRKLELEQLWSSRA